jgi:hypothetical protein
MPAHAKPGAIITPPTLQVKPICVDKSILRCAKGRTFDFRFFFGTHKVEEFQEETRSHLALTYDRNGAIDIWAPNRLPPGQALREPAPLFRKLDGSVVEEEYARLEV